MKKILSIVLKEKNYFEKNPKSLAKIMKEYENLHMYSLYHPDEKYHNYDNPKDSILDLEEKFGESYLALVYDAWCSGHEGRKKIKNYRKGDLEIKINKTMDDYLKMMLNPNYEFKSIFPDKKSVYCHLLCTIGTGMAWNKDGFITDIGPSGLDYMLFSNFSLVKIPKHMMDLITWKNDPNYILGRKSYMKDINKRERENRKSSKRLEEMKKLMIKLKIDKPLKKIEPRTYYPLAEEYSLICKLPDNAHISYKKAAKKICEEILVDINEKKSNKKIAKKLLDSFN